MSAYPAPTEPLDAVNANISRHLASMAALSPERAALKIPRGRTRRNDIDYATLSFAELHAEVETWAERLTGAGIRRGDRSLVMVRQGLPLIASVFALFRIGAVPVIIDPGMGLKSFLSCVRHSRPRALVGIPLAQIISRVFRPSFASVSVRVSASHSLVGRLRKKGAVLPERGSLAVRSKADELAAILFTSGSTGAPKGVCYEHGMFEAQVRLIRDAYGISPGEIDLPLLPIFALFNPALGMTTVVPELDPRRPASLDPARIVQAIAQEGVTNSFGSPTLWRKIADHCVAKGITLPTLRRVLCAGAPVPTALWRHAATMLPQGRLHSPYGATEALPVASVSANEIPADSVAGACVGRPIRGVEVKVMALTDGPLARLEDGRELPVGEVGEIVVAGSMTTKAYDGRPDATAAAKIRETRAGAEVIWHRMGDCGYFDAEGRLWFCGRKVERVETSQGVLHTEPCEQVFRRHRKVGRCALIGLGERGRQRPAIVVETTLSSSAECRRFARELALLAREHEHTRMIRTFYFREKFPVDVRHNAKIHRLTLARWAAQAVGYESDPKR